MNLPRLAILALLILASTLTIRSTGAAAGPLLLTGSIDGAAYKIEVPATWNGTLLLYSHYYMPPGAPNPAVDARDPVIGAWLLAHGYALAGSAYLNGTGFAVAQGFHDQMALLDFFAKRVGAPRRTIAWGQSMGGLISAGLVQQFPTRFSGALAMCGLMGGAVASWNGNLDFAFALKTLLAPTPALRLVHISNPGANLQQLGKILAAAQRTAQGRARLALAAALADIPGWIDGSSPEPAPGDFTAQEQNQFLWEQNYLGPFTFGLRAELEHRAGGNPSWNTGVDYSELLAHSVDYAEVQFLYQQAGLDLEQDLTALQQAPRIAADPGAVAYLSRNINFTGQIRVPVLTLHTTSDGLVPVEAEQAYARMVAAAGHSSLLRQVFVQRAHHCSFTRAETLTALQALMHRVDTGRWGDSTSPAALNLEAAALGSDPALPRIATLPGFTDFYPTAMTTRPFAPAFVPFKPPSYLRPFDGRSPH
jgi:dienelactone hydrolase